MQDILGIRYFPETLLDGALCFLLFAGALQVDMESLWSRKITVALLAILGVLIATAIFGGVIYAVFSLSGVAVPLSWCVVLGAILGPTDPVAVGGLLSRIGLRSRLRAVMAGESLFNDGIGVVIFKTAVAVAIGGGEPHSTASIALDLGREAGGGFLIGAVTGWMAYRAMVLIDDYPLEIMISLALATGTYVIANQIGASGPIAVVVAGLLIGSRGTQYDHERSNSPKSHVVHRRNPQSSPVPASRL